MKRFIINIFFLSIFLPVNAQDIVPRSFFSAPSNAINANGIAVADYDRDGDLDVFIVARDGYDLGDSQTWNRLYQNQLSGFTDVTVSTGLDKDQFQGESLTLQEGIKMGASWGDYDSDGYPDLFLTNQGPDQLWHNERNGKFTNVTETTGVGGPENRYSSSALWWDYDHDGDLDLYVSSWAGKNTLYRNDDGTQFVDVSDESGLANNSNTWTSIPLDIDKDGWIDLYMVNDFQTNYMFLNNADGTFTNATTHFNLHDSGNGMGVDICDFGNDGNFDIYLTNISQLKKNPFFVNNGNSFDNLSTQLGIDDAKWGWGCRFFDFDHDMDEDLYVVNQEFFGGPLEYNRFYELVNGQFEDKSLQYGLDNTSHSRTQEAFDYNNDGDVDILLGNWGETSILFDNQKSHGNWVKINLEGTTSNRNAFGTVVRIKTPDGKYQHRLNHGVNFLGQSIKPVHFGLSANDYVEEVTIYWPNGRVERITDLDINQTYFFVEGEQEEVKDEIIYGTAPDEIFIEEENLVSKSVARRWNELLLESIRRDFARPTVHARNLFHTSMAMYDAWAVFHKEAQTIFLGKTFGNYVSSFDGMPNVGDTQAAQEEAISFATYRILSHRFNNSPGGAFMLAGYTKLIKDLGYDINNTSINYSSGDAAALGNYIAEQIIEFGLQDGSNEINDYKNQHYSPINQPLVVDNPGNPDIAAPNSWQPLTLSTFIDQSGNVIEESTPDFLSPEWGQVAPFAITNENVEIHNRNGFDYRVYYDPGEPVNILSDGTLGLDDPYKWGFAMVSVWSAHLDPSDGKMIDISPASIGNTSLSDFPKTFEEYKSYYNFFEGGDLGKGHNVNPVTGQPYVPQMVPRGDYARVLAEFWADGPDSETPPGHWFTILNYVNDHPLTVKKFSGKGDVLDDLEWDVKSYLALGGAMHDVAISAWGIKGYYDYIRPISAIRYMASKGQSTDTTLPNYHSEGIPLIPDYIELIEAGDPLAGDSNENLGRIKLYAWKGTHFVDDPDSDVAGVDWILAEDWVPYQRPSFVTPPFAGYVSGHSTFSRAAAEVLTQLTGSNFFPGGMGVFNTKKNRFLVFEDGPSQDLSLQWATYQDASDQTSLSRIWGGIHPPIDDIPGRLIGEEIGKIAFDASLNYFYQDEDNDGFFSFEDCDDKNDQIKDCEDESEDKNKPLEFTLYPVPVEDEMTLSINYNGPLIFRVYNLYGAITLKKEVFVQNNQCSINLGNLTTGIYILVCSDQNDNKLMSQKIIKK